jgi:hypothetical protein
MYILVCIPLLDDDKNNDGFDISFHHGYGKYPTAAIMKIFHTVPRFIH